MSFAVVGDCLLDVVVRPRAGSRAPDLGGDADAAIDLGPGGQAANVAVRLARRGRKVRLVAPLADDAGGNLLRSALAADGVEVSALAAERTGSVVVLVDAAGERTMYSDRMAVGDPDALRALGAEGWVHVSGYALAGEPGAALAAELGRSSALVSVNGGSVAVGDARAAELARRLAALRPALVVFSRQEAVALLRRPADEGDLAGSLAVQLRAVVVLTDGARGASAAWPDGGRSAAPAVPAHRVDATGAGDAFAAALIDVLSRAPWPPTRRPMEEALAAAALLASRVVAVVGAQARVEGERPAGRPVGARKAGGSGPPAAARA